MTKSCIIRSAFASVRILMIKVVIFCNLSSEAPFYFSVQMQFLLTGAGFDHVQVLPYTATSSAIWIALICSPFCDGKHPVYKIDTPKGSLLKACHPKGESNVVNSCDFSLRQTEK